MRTVTASESGSIWTASTRRSCLRSGSVRIVVWVYIATYKKAVGGADRAMKDNMAQEDTFGVPLGYDRSLLLRITCSGIVGMIMVVMVVLL